MQLLYIFNYAFHSIAVCSAELRNSERNFKIIPNLSSHQSTITIPALKFRTFISALDIINISSNVLRVHLRVEQQSYEWTPHLLRMASDRSRSIMFGRMPRGPVNVCTSSAARALCDTAFFAESRASTSTSQRFPITRDIFYISECSTTLSTIQFFSNLRH